MRFQSLGDLPALLRNMLGNNARTLLGRHCRRNLAAHNFRMSIRLASNNFPAISPSLLPADEYQLLPTSQKAGLTEDALFEKQIHDVQELWDSPRYEGIKRPYSAQDVVSKRGALQQVYASSLMARKLFNLFKEKAAAEEPVHTSSSPLEEEVDKGD